MPAFKLDPEALSKLLVPYMGDKAYLHTSVKSCALIIVVPCLSPCVRSVYVFHFSMANT